jgi:NitT/TauT family transport system ATP-binding protein
MAGLGRATEPGASRAPSTTHQGIHAERLRKVFTQTVSGQQNVAIENLSFSIRPREIVAIVGRTGCGKSTLINILLGLDRPDGGRILIDGRDPNEDFRYFRGRIAAIFQDDRLLPWRTALDNARLGLELLRRPREVQEEQARAWLERVGLAGSFGAFPRELSGGMRQRVALARAFAVEPELLVADEAFGHLDEVTGEALRATFLEMVRREQKTTLLVTHQLEEAIRMADRILVLGRPATLLADLPSAGRSPADLTDLRAEIQAMIRSNRGPGSGHDPRKSEVTT